MDFGVVHIGFFVLFFVEEVRCVEIDFVSLTLFHWVGIEVNRLGDWYTVFVSFRVFVIVSM